MKEIESVGAEKQEALNRANPEGSTPKDFLTHEEREAYNFHAMRIMKAKEARTYPFRKFDGLNLIQDYYSNEDAVNSYLRPKRNDDEVRVVGGTTEKRYESMVNELLSMNQQPEIRAMDKYDLEVQGLGKCLEDVVLRTNQIEDDEDIRKDAIHELLSQRAVFIEDVFLDRKASGMPFGMCRKRLRTSLEVLLGDVTLPAYRFQEQPYVAVYDCTSYWNAEREFGRRPNWSKVIPGPSSETADIYGPNATFRIGILAKEQVEIVKYMSVLDDEFQVYVNGVPMFPVGTRLPFRSKRYPLAMAIPKRMSAHLAYGRPMSASLKYLQALSDEMVRNVIRKFRQAIEPPRAVEASKHIYSRDIFESGKITYGVNADQFKPLIDHKGVTEAEMSVLNLVKSMQDELAARGNTALGIQEGRRDSATATIEQAKQAIKMLGLFVLAWDGLVRDYTRLRIDNIIENMLDPIGHDVDPMTKELKAEFRRFTVKGKAFENGKVGDKIVQLTDKALGPEESMALGDWEDEQERNGNPIRVAFLDVNVIRRNELIFDIRVVSKPEESGSLDRILFDEKVMQSQKIGQMVGRQLNGEKIINEFQETWRVKDWFLDSGEGPAAGAPGMGMPPGQGPGQDAMSGMVNALARTANPSPGIRTVVGAVK